MGLKTWTWYSVDLWENQDQKGDSKVEWLVKRIGNPSSLGEIPPKMVKDEKIGKVFFAVVPWPLN